MATDFTNPNQQEILGLERQRALAQAIMKSGVQTPQSQMVGDRYVAPSATQYLGNLAQTLAGAYGENQINKRELALANAIRGKQQQASADYLTAMQGQNVNMPQQQGPMPTGGNIPVQTQNTGPDYGAAFRAATSPYAPTALQTQGYDILKPVTTKEGETISVRNLTPGGGMTTIATGGEKKSEQMRNYNLAKSEGFPGTFFEYEAALKRAGAPSITNQVGASLAGQVGDMLKESKANAVSGYQTIISADKILSTTGKAVTGPLANVRLSALQVADTLGVTGKDTKDKLAATRQVLQETGKLALAAPPKGQGSVSNYERDLYTRAASGNIDFTPTELNLIAKRAKENGGYLVQQHNEMINQAQSLGPDVAKVSKMYQVNPPTQIQPEVAPSVVQPTNKAKFLGFE